MLRVTLSILVYGMAAVADLSAQSEPLPSRRTIAEYLINDVTLRVSADAPRVEVFLWRKPHAIVVFLDARSIERWADSASELIRDEAHAQSPAPVERSTPVLRHTDSSYQSGLRLTRLRTSRGSQLFLTAWLGDHRTVSVPLRAAQARGFVVVLRDAAHVARRSR
ncbi:MAG TPA: hypothetical protein VFB46_02380 [Gemmatimonadaceae bacterium]|nr:hypothetical protein [Gemmatimonadaceae bacterium]